MGSDRWTMGVAELMYERREVWEVWGEGVMAKAIGYKK
jgi:hypothetical protein